MSGAWLAVLVALHLQRVRVCTGGRLGDAKAKAKRRGRWVGHRVEGGRGQAGLCGCEGGVIDEVGVSEVVAPAPPLLLSVVLLVSVVYEVDDLR